MSNFYADDRAVYVISVAAELAGMHPQTLRIYERKGLVSPARTGGGSRRYSDADIAQLQRIQRLTEDGLNLAGVKRVIELEAELDAVRAELDELRYRRPRRWPTSSANIVEISCPSTRASRFTVVARSAVADPTGELPIPD